MEAPCRIEMLGGLRALVGGREVTRFRTEKAGGLLAYLAYHVDKHHPREILAELLWPWSAPRPGRRSLTSALSSLRRQLEPPGIDKGAVIGADRFAVWLEPDNVATDVAEFEAALGSADDAAGADRRHWLEAAVALYGGRLLPGYYQDWIIPEQERLADLYFGAVRSLAQDLEAAGDLEAAVAYCHRAVAADPLREEAHRDLVRLVAVAGQVDDALRHYDELERTLAQELGEEPSPAAQELKEALLALRAGAPAASLDVPPRGEAAASETMPSGMMALLLVDIDGGGDLGTQEQLQAHGGLLVGELEGTSTWAFGRPSEALRAAIAVQQAVSEAEPSGGVDGPRARMALDVGEVETDGGTYSGPVIDRATALLLAAHGGQLLCSNAAAAFLEGDLPEGVRLDDLGYYRLRGLERPEKLISVEYPGMPSDPFPAPKASLAYRTKLPPQVTRFFGREEELAQLEETVLAEQTRLVTLTGPGGSGKTRLAIETAGRLPEVFHGAVWFVPLQDLTDARLIPTSIADAMELPRSSETEPLEQAIEALSRQPCLLVLDNFEQLTESGASLLRQLLDRAPELKCLVTSRHRLNLNGEVELLVAPLPTPEGGAPLDEVATCPSVELFVDRAQSPRPDFQITDANVGALAELCDTLEGIPLAIELAAARAKVLTPAQMLERMEDRFDLLVSRRPDAIERHRTLWAAVEWSHDLLPGELQRFFAKLSVFRGGWTLEAAETVCDEPHALDHLEQLADSSLVLTDDDRGATPQTRFHLLETLREYASQHVPENDLAALSKRHAEYFLSVAEDLDPARPTSPGRGRIGLLEREGDNLRLAMDWLEGSPDGAEAGLRLATALVAWWRARGHVPEGRQRLNNLLSAACDGIDPLIRARALRTAGELALEGSDPAVAEHQYSEALEVSQAAGDASLAAACRHGLARAIGRRGDTAGAQHLVEQNLAWYREEGDKAGVSACLALLGSMATRLGDYELAERLTGEALSIRRSLGRRRQTAPLLNALGNVATLRGDLHTAQLRYEEALLVADEDGDVEQRAMYAGNLGHIALRRGELSTARQHFQATLAASRQSGALHDTAATLHNLGLVAAEEGDYGKAAVLLEEALAISREAGSRMREAEHLDALGTVALRRAEHGYARRSLAQAVSIWGELSALDCLAQSHRGLARLEAACGDHDAALGHLRASLALFSELNSDPYEVAACLQVAGNVLRHCAGPHLALRMLAVADALMHTTQRVLPRADRKELEAEIEACRGELGHPTSSTVWAEGRALELDQALAEALQRVEAAGGPGPPS